MKHLVRCIKLTKNCRRPNTNSWKDSKKLRSLMNLISSIFIICCIYYVIKDFFSYFTVFPPNSKPEHRHAQQPDHRHRNIDYLQIVCNLKIVPGYVNFINNSNTISYSLRLCIRVPNCLQMFNIPKRQS